mmetsp:Transcript_52383/g.111613  ORF Transcript_52383/g.111613 Transcript_52383/m.111613 type:complete len:213 (-) Transcript_52383:146-784(-)
MESVDKPQICEDQLQPWLPWPCQQCLTKVGASGVSVEVDRVEHQRQQDHESCRHRAPGRPQEARRHAKSHQRRLRPHEQDEPLARGAGAEPQQAEEVRAGGLPGAQEGFAKPQPPGSLPHCQRPSSTLGAETEQPVDPRPAVRLRPQEEPASDLFAGHREQQVAPSNGGPRAVGPAVSAAEAAELDPAWEPMLPDSHCGGGVGHFPGHPPKP